MLNLMYLILAHRILLLGDSSFNINFDEFQKTNSYIFKRK